MKTKIIVMGTFIAVAAHADPYQELDKVNQQVREHIQTRSSQLSSGGLAPEQAALLQQQNAADSQALDSNRSTTRAVRARDANRGAFSDSTYLMMLQANQASQAAAAAAAKKSSGGSDSSKSSTPNPAFQIQKLDVPDAKFDTSVPTDSPLLGDLQDKVKSLGKILEEPVDTKQLSTSESIDKEIADLQSANETRITLMRAAAAFAVGAERERAAKKEAPPPKSLADELKELDKQTGGGGALDKASQALDATKVPFPKASHFKSDSSTPPNSGGHVDTLSGQSPPAGFDPKVISTRDSSAK